MPFAITALFDKRTEESIGALRMRLAQAGYGEFASAEVRPHLTLAILPALDANALREPLRDWCAARSPLALDIAAVGTFPTAEGVVYLAPVVTFALLEMNARLQALLDAAGLPGFKTYRPDSWVPHITVGIQLAPEAVAGAVRLAREADVFHTATITQTAVAKFPPLRAVYVFPLGQTSAEPETRLV